jgi:hypothetical protein
LRRWRAPRRGSVGAGRRRSHRSDGPPLGELGPATTRRFGRPSRTTRPGWRDQTGYGRGGVQQHHAGNLVGTGGGEGEDVQAAEGVTGEHVGPGNVCAWSSRVWRSVVVWTASCGPSAGSLQPRPARSSTQTLVSRARTGAIHPIAGRPHPGLAPRPLWGCRSRCSSGAADACPHR